MNRIIRMEKCEIGLNHPTSIQRIETFAKGVKLRDGFGLNHPTSTLSPIAPEGIQRIETNSLTARARYVTSGLNHPASTQRIETPIRQPMTHRTSLGLNHPTSIQRIETQLLDSEARGRG